jgi:hypothetical protein
VVATPLAKVISPGVIAFYTQRNARFYLSRSGRFVLTEEILWTS